MDACRSPNIEFWILGVCGGGSSCGLVVGHRWSLSEDPLLILGFKA